MSWLAKAVLPLWKKNNSIQETKPEQLKEEEEEEEELGVTEELGLCQVLHCGYLQQLLSPSSRVTVKKSTMTPQRLVRGLGRIRVSGRNAFVLLKVKEMSHLRYVLCPRHLKERQFWRIYFHLVKSYVTPYEICAIQKAKLRRMGKEDEKLDGAFEVEMAEAKRATSVTFPTSLEHDLEVSSK